MNSLASTTGPVLIVGTGLLGASIGLGLRSLDVPVWLQDASPTAVALARDVGAGQIRGPEHTDPALVIIAAPPDVTADLIAAALREFPGAVVTDVASVKGVLLEELREVEGLDLRRYVGSHPMAGRERSGAAAATSELFAGRPWVIAAHPEVDPAAVRTVRHLAADLDASPVHLEPVEHDEAVALVSHLPQMMASLVAGRLVGAAPEALALSGQGLRDVTRIAASDARLWAAIITGNAAAVHDGLRAVRADLDEVITALERAATEGPLAEGAAGAVSALIGAGNEGAGRIPGKHGGARRHYAEVTVLVPDEPGELGRLFTEIGQIGVNIEDFAMEHSPKQKVGMAIVSVLPDAAGRLERDLGDRGWRVVAP
ncbi:prephenate dehydrogenase [Pseudactinotalea sp. Z1739]|uniref:prephenate dehydrogenase n=1 Tax=Pseudactinotalea sp. Z1739 TaxID=3413028 RepID=UPI003C7D9A29